MQQLPLCNAACDDDGDDYDDWLGISSLVSSIWSFFWFALAKCELDSLIACLLVSCLLICGVLYSMDFSPLFVDDVLQQIQAIAVFVRFHVLQMWTRVILPAI
jgi:hypothetical protein